MLGVSVCTVRSQDVMMTPSAAREYFAHALSAFPGDTVLFPLKCGFGAALVAAAVHGSDLGAAALRSGNPALAAQRTFISPSGHFRILFDTEGVDAPALTDADWNGVPDYIDTVALSFDRAWRVEIDSLGYIAPPASTAGSPYYDVRVRDLAGTMYGQTLFGDSLRAGVPNPTYRTSIEVDNNYSESKGFRTVGVAALEVTAAHEFHHAIQLGSYGFWSDDVYFYELTSTWMEDVVFPGVNDFFYYLPAFFRRPDLPFTASNGYAEYGRCVFGKFIEQRFGAGVMRSAWGNIPSERPLKALGDALSTVGTSFVREMTEFWIWNLFTGYRAQPGRYYAEAALFPLVKFEHANPFVPPSAVMRGTGQPLSSHFLNSFSGSDTLSVVLCNVDEAAAEADRYAAQEFELSLKAPDGSSGVGNLSVSLTSGDRRAWWDRSFAGASPAGSPLASPYPNPFHPDGHRTVLIPLPSTFSGNVELSLYDASLELVLRRSVSADVRKGLYTGLNGVAWDGKDDKGKIVSTGVYWYIAESVGVVQRGKIAVVR